jgi:polar amino acid transport system permease protein
MALDKILIQMLNGSLSTVGLFFITLVLALPLGLGLMLLYINKNKIIKNITGFYILIMRGTPLLLQMFFIFYGLPTLPYIGGYFDFNRFQACCVAFVLNYAAYFAEIFRGGLLAIDKGQGEAAKVLGLSKRRTLIKIILPQMVRVSLPSISNEAIILVKDTSLMTALGVVELLGATETIVNRTVSIMPFGIAALFYLVMSWTLTVFFRKMEERYSF